jgi:gamma-glutamyl hydrolase
VDFNQMPVIGILSQQLTPEMKEDPAFEGKDSYMMAAYARFMEAAGARVVPLIMGEPLETTLEKMSKLNGVLFPGGGGDYIDFGRPIYENILEQNDAGSFLPGWGTCLGFEALANWASSEGTSVLGQYSAHAVSLPLEFTVDPVNTKMFGYMGESAYLWETYEMTLNSHG